MASASSLMRSAVAVATALSLVTASPRRTGAQNPDGSLGGRPAPVPPDTNTLAILPFNVSGPPGVEYLGESMMDLLAMALDGRAGVKVLYPQFVLRQVGPGARRTDPTAVAPIVRDLGAGRVVGGSVVVAGTQLRISVDVFDARRGVLQFPLRTQGTVDGLAAAADTLASLLLARRLVPARVLQQRGIADYATSSADALRAVLVGEQATRRGDYKVAADSFKSAVRLDPDFGLAWTSMIANEGKAGGVTGPGFNRAALMDSVMRKMVRFTPRLRRLVEYGVAFDRQERYRAIQLANALAADYPTDGAALSLKADANFHFGLNIGVPLHAVIEMFWAALRMDDGNFELLQHFGALLAQAGDTTAELAVTRRCNEVRPGSCDRNGIDIRYNGARPWAQSFGPNSSGQLPNMFFLNTSPEWQLPFSVAVVDSASSVIVGAPDADPVVRRDRLGQKQLIAYANGRYEAAWRLMDSIRGVGPPAPNAMDARLRLHSLITGQHHDSAAATLRRPPPVGLVVRSSRAWFATQFLSADSAEVYFREMTPNTSSDTAFTASIVTGFRGLRALRDGDTTRARDLLVQALQNHGRRTVPDRAFWPASAFVYQLAQIQFARRDFAGAQRTLFDLRPVWDAIYYLAPGEELRAHVELALGDTTAARVALRNFVGLWDKADPPLQPRVAAARALLARIEPR